MDLDIAALSLVIAIASAALLVNRAETGRRLRDHFSTIGSPINLAVFRIVICGTVLVRVREVDAIGAARRLVDVPDVLQSPPFVMGWLLPVLPISEPWVTVAGAGLVGGAALALVGLWTRPAAGLAAVSAIYVLGVPNWFGKVNHDHHHLVWFLILLALAPSGDALSVDSWRRRRRGEPPAQPSIAHALPIRLTWLALGFVYLSAGLGKVLLEGFDWPLHDNMRNFLWLHWVWHDPPARVDSWTWVLVAVGCLTLALELTFLPATFSRRLRPVVAAAGFAFHLGVRAFLGIASFWTLQAAYVSFVDWEAIANRLRGRRVEPSRPSTKRELPRRQAAASGLLIVAVAVPAVALWEHAWPVAAYPSFGYRQGTTAGRLEMVVVEQGSERVVEGLADSLPLGAARFRFLTVRTLGLPDPDLRHRRLTALWSLLRETDPSLHGAEEVRIFRVTFSLDPDDRALLGRSLVATLPAVDGDDR